MDIQPDARDLAVVQLRAAIKGSGLSIRAFAEERVLREERTVRRWLDGDHPIPQVVRAWLEREAV